MTNKKQRGSFCLIFLMLFIPGILMAQHEDLFMLMEHTDSFYRILGEGNLLQFYEKIYDYSMLGEYTTNTGIIGGAIYNIIVYFILGVWMLPIKGIELLISAKFPLGVWVIWCKGLLVTVVILSAAAINHLSLYLDKNSGNQAFIFWVCSPMMIFVSILFGQVDIFTALIEICALKIYLEKQYQKFSIVMAVAFAIKGFALFMYVPLLLIVEKRPVQLLKHLILFLWFKAITYMCFMNNDSYRIVNNGINERMNYFQRLLYSTVRMGKTEIPLLFAFLVILCIFCYSIEPTESRRKKYAILIPLCAYTGFILFVDWNPQWTVLILPFLALSVNYIKDYRTFYYTDILFETSFIVTCCVYFRNNVDDEMINHGIIGLLSSKSYKGGYLGVVYDRFGFPREVAFTIMVAALVCLVYLVYRDMFIKTDTPENTIQPLLFNKMRYLVILLFLSATIILWIVKSK